MVDKLSVFLTVFPIGFNVCTTSPMRQRQGAIPRPYLLIGRFIGERVIDQITQKDIQGTKGVKNLACLFE
jgi:hypothetical protein